MSGKRELLGADVIAERLTQPEWAGWEAGEACLRQTFHFRDFVVAFGWMASVALVAEKIDHHPNWTNVYRTVEVELNTHDAGGVTELDFRLASAMNKLATLHGGSR